MKTSYRNVITAVDNDFPRVDVTINQGLKGGIVWMLMS
jgi:hypothetical protein